MSMRMRGREPMKDGERRAWVANGYASHFLQDSFAAGHLINKTLVMQWFVDYTKDLGWGSRPHFGLPDRTVLDAMSTKRQPDLANRRAYSKTRLDTSATEDRRSGRVTTDPQTLLERGDQEGRLAGSGLRSKDPEATKEYAELEQFFNSSFLNLAAGEVHDYFNRTGVTVTNAAGQQFLVGGDGAMLRLQSEEAIGVALQANTQADQAISEILASGDTTIDPKAIFDLFPSAVVIDGKAVPLERWNDEFVRAYAREHVFPGMAERLDYKVVRTFGKRLLENGRVLTPKR